MTVFFQGLGPCSARASVSHLVSPGCPRWVAIVDDGAPMRDALLDLLDEAGFAACAFASGEEFLASGRQYEC
jgi:hypothetical protein